MPAPAPNCTINFKFLRGLVNIFQYETEPVYLSDEDMGNLFEIETRINKLPALRVHIEARPFNVKESE